MTASAHSYVHSQVLHSPLWLAIAILVMVAATPPSRLAAQQPRHDTTRQSTFLIGPFGSYLLGAQTGTFQVFAGSPGCGTFDGAQLTTTLFGIAAAYRRDTSDQIFITARASWARAEATYAAAPIEDQRLFDTVAQQVIELQREYRLTATTTRLCLDLLADYQPMPGLLLSAGPWFGYRLGGTFQQTDNILAPADRSFNDGERQRNMAQGQQLTANQFGFGPLIRVAADFPFAKRMRLQPELAARAQLTSGVQEMGWYGISGAAGLSLLFDLSPAPDTSATPTQIPTPPPPDTTQPKRAPTLQASLKMSGMDEAGKPSPQAWINVREIIQRTTTPFLASIFFDSAETELPQRYPQLAKAEADTFTIALLVGKGPLELHQQGLNLLGLRMRNDPTSRLVLLASAAPNEPVGIGQERAKKIREYLASVWDVSPRRVELRAAPATTSSPMDPARDQQAELRKVTFASTTPLLTASLTTEQLVRDFNPPRINLSPTWDAEAGLLRWEIRMMQGDHTVANFSSDDSTAESSKNFAWQIQDQRIDSTLGNITAQLTVVDSAGQSVTVRDSILLKMRRDTSVIETSRVQQGKLERITQMLVGFDYRAAQGNNDHQRLIRELSERVAPGAEITITGYTDRIGDDRANQQLSRERAEYVAGLLRQLLAQRGIGDATITTIAAGAETSRFPNYLPEGRILSRGTVIVVEQQRNGKW
ncbi:MAG: OmpA family protein [Chlorobi bacterium]|nr:OmpA family protein [Chlorobiota bacterium]